MSTRSRRKILSRRPKFASKNLPYILSMTICWGVLIWSIINIDPIIIQNIFVSGLYLPFFLLLELTLLLSFKVFLKSWSRSIWWSLGISIYLLLRLLGLGGVINIVLILALIIVLEYYRKLTIKERMKIEAEE